MLLYKFAGMAIASFSAFTLLSALLPAWGRIIALVALTVTVAPFFLSGDEDNPNLNGGLGSLVSLVAVALLALMLGA